MHRFIFLAMLPTWAFLAYVVWNDSTVTPCWSETRIGKYSLFWFWFNSGIGSHTPYFSLNTVSGRDTVAGREGGLDRANTTEKSWVSSINPPPPRLNCAGIFDQSVGARNRAPGCIGWWNRFLGNRFLCRVKKYGLWFCWVSTYSAVLHLNLRISCGAPAMRNMSIIV
jgi:hypothetical protein